MKKVVFSLLCFSLILSNSSFASPASVLELLAKEAVKAVGGEIGKAAIEKFKALFNSNKEIAKKGNPKLAHETPLKNKGMWTISPGNLSQKDLERLAKILKSLDNDTDQVIKIKGSDNVVATTQNGSVRFGTYQEIVGSSAVNSINQQETKTVISDSPGAVVNSPGATIGSDSSGHNSRSADQGTTAIKIENAKDIVLKDIHTSGIDKVLDAKNVEGLAARSITAEKEKFQSQLVEITDKNFINERVMLDGHFFKNCKFDNCTIAIDQGNFRLMGCTFSNCTLLLGQNAMNIALFMKGYFGDHPISFEGEAKALADKAFRK